MTATYDDTVNALHLWLVRASVRQIAVVVELDFRLMSNSLFLRKNYRKIRIINDLTGIFCPRGSSTVTSTLPLPAEKVSTVKLAGAPTTGPVGSTPGP